MKILDSVSIVIETIRFNIPSWGILLTKEATLHCHLQTRVHSVDASSNNHLDVYISVQTIPSAFTNHTGMLDSPRTVQSRNRAKGLHGATIQSKIQLLQCAAGLLLACCIGSLPDPVDLLKEIFLAVSDRHNARLSCGLFSSAVTMLSHRIPARSPSTAMASKEDSVSSSDLTTTVQSTANAAAIPRVPISMGKFHGVISPHIPIGSCV